MPDVPKHAWTHRPRSQGGTDPIPSGLPWIRVHNDSESQVVTATTELVFKAGSLGPGADGVFGIDVVDDPSGVLIYQQGIYQILADVNVGSVDIAKPRAMYTHWNLLSAGVSFGDELKPGIGTGQNSSSISEVNSSPALISKSRLSHYAVATLTGGPIFPGDPFRVGVVLQYGGVSYTIQNLISSLTIVQLCPGNSTFIDFTP